MSKPFVWAMLALSLQILAIVILIPGNWTHKAVTSELALIESALARKLPIGYKTGHPVGMSQPS